jgi:hypothetical protein
MGEYSGWGHFGFHWITPFHNIVDILAESAAAQLATPLYLHPEQLHGGVRNLPKYEEETVFPNPRRGGWWRLRDIVERQKVSAWATLDPAARNKDTVLWNAYLKGKRQTERGPAGKPGLCHSCRPARSADGAADDQQYSGAGHRDPAGLQAVQSAERYDLCGGKLCGLDGPAEDGPDPLPAGPHVLSRQRLDAR